MINFAELLFLQINTAIYSLPIDC